VVHEYATERRGAAALIVGHEGNGAIFYSNFVEVVGGTTTDDGVSVSGGFERDSDSNSDCGR